MATAVQALATAIGQIVQPQQQQGPGRDAQQGPREAQAFLAAGQAVPTSRFVRLKAVFVAIFLQIWGPVNCETVCQDKVQFQYNVARWAPTSYK